MFETPIYRSNFKLFKTYQQRKSKPKCLGGKISCIQRVALTKVQGKYSTYTNHI